MRKRLLTTLAVLAVLLAGGYLTLWWTAPRHNISQAGFDAIQLGMTQEEVEAILGGPPGIYGRKDPDEVPWFDQIDGNSRDRWALPMMQWVGDNFGIAVF